MKIWITASIILCFGFHPLKPDSSRDGLKDMSILQNAIYLILYRSGKGKTLSIKLTE